jgi:hypothetical protein
MAILDGLKNAVAANTARAANQVAVNGLRNIVGNVFGVDLNPTNPAAQLTNRPTKYSTQNLSYPAGVEGDDQQGHYIIFEILQQDKAKLVSFSDGAGILGKINDTIANQYDSIPKPSLDPTSGHLVLKSPVEKAAENVVKEKYTGKSSNSLQLAKKATTRIETMIALYMPPSISVKYESKYGEQNIGAMAAAGEGAIAAFAGRGGATVGTAIKGAGAEAKSAVSLGVQNATNAVFDGAKAVVALEKGAIRTPRMELMFEGVGRRQFSYEFVFIPKDESEAEEIEKIVKQFKFHMASRYTDETFREMEIPSMFNIRYMHRNAENTHLNKISTCALENMEVSYGSERFVAYEGGRPQTTKITLAFKEMEIITKDKIAQGF